MELITTRYPKSIKSPFGGYNVLKPGSNNAKLGFTIIRKKWKGKRIYSLTLIERETCPPDCHHWDDCYGNNMPFAHRFEVDGVMDKVKEELAYLVKKHKLGVVVRLHVLGDFYSTFYVEFWQEMLLTYPTLCIFGYTGRREDSDIGKAIWLLNHRFNERCLIRFSRSKEYDSENEYRYAAEETFEGDAITCPEQLNLTESCATCGLCWTVPTTIRFVSH